MLTTILFNNFDSRQAFIVRAQTKANLVANIAAEIVKHNMSDVCTNDLDTNEADGIEHAGVELTYVECYAHFEVSEDGGANSEHYRNFAEAATEFAKLVVDAGYYNS
jgi:hypothetical protein